MRKGLTLLFLGILMFSVTFEQGVAQNSSKQKHIAVIVKGTNSDFWQYVLIGANNYAIEHPDLVRVTNHGPESDIDMEKQLSILEDVVTSRPDAIVLASTNSDSPVPIIERAMKLGIPVVIIDTKVSTDTVTTFLATDNKKAGNMAADMLVEGLKKAGKPIKGKVAFVSAYPGIASLIARQEGFVERIKQIAPDLQILPLKYSGTDIAKGMGTIEDVLTANPDIIGFFGDCNIVGSSFARVARERNLLNKVIAVSFDSDNEEIQALKDGIIYSLIVQDPYAMGYKGVDTALRAINGQKFASYLDTGEYAVKKENMNEPKMRGLLDPFTLKK
jgi:ribose transport system substrate-binding protein